MVKTLTLFEDKSVAKSSLGVKTPHVENFNSTFKYLEGEIQALGKNSASLKQEEKKLKKEIDDLQERMNHQNSLLLDESMPVLKNFMKKVKENGNREKAELYKMSRYLMINLGN